jgi:hypothetical protein
MRTTLLIIRFAKTGLLQSCLSLSSMFAGTLTGQMLSPWMSGNGLGIRKIYYSITVLGKYHEFSFCV